MIAAAATIVLAAGCATRDDAIGPRPPAGPTVSERTPLPVERVAPKIRDRQAADRVPEVALAVRSAGPGEIDQRSFDEIQRGLGVGAAIGVVALTEVAVLPFAMFSPGALLGGIVVTIGSAILMQSERATQERIAMAVREADFEARLGAALGARVASRPQAPATLEVVLLTHGVVEDRPRGTYCVFAEVEIVLHRDGADQYRDRVHILPARRSTDAPVPDCRARETLADADRRVIQDAFHDYAIAIAAIVQRRLPGLPWRD